MVPMQGLYTVLSAPPLVGWLLGTCGGDPAPTSSGAISRGTTRKPALVAVPALEFVDASTPGNLRLQALLTAQDKHAAVQLVEGGMVRGLNARSSPAGHGPTNLEKWCALAPDTPCYEVFYAVNYEPYGIFSRLHAPRFDERFRGQGMDRAAYYWFLNYIGWDFWVLPAAYVLSAPQPVSKDTHSHQDENELKTAAHGLFQRYLADMTRAPLVVLPSQ